MAEEAAEAPAPAAVLPALHYPYAFGAPLTYTVPAIQPIQYKYVPKEYEVEVKSFQPEVQATGCVNVFGTPVPCREKREADEEEAAAPAATVQLPYYYAGYPYGLHYPAAPVVTYAAPKVHEIEVPTPVLKHTVEKIPLQPLCQNHLGLAVPCA